MAEKKRSRRKIWKPFIKFYTRFPIPWWLFVISFLAAILYTELELRLLTYTIMINTGDLYNRALLGYAGLTLLMSLTSIIVNMTGAYGQGKVTLRARNMVWRKSICLPIQDFDREKPSSLISRITADVPQAGTAITTLSATISSLYALSRTIYILWQYNHTVACWMLSVIPLAVVTFWICGKTQFVGFQKKFAATNRMMSFFAEHISSVKHAKAWAAEEPERQEGFREIETRFQADVLYALFAALQVTVYSVYTNICMIILVFTGKYEIEKGRLESTGINKAHTYEQDVQKFLAENLTHYQNIKAVQGVLEPVSRLTCAETERIRREMDMPETPQDLTIEHVRFGYTAGQEVLRDLSLTIPAGKKTAIVGDNGSGKSTLFKLLMRFYEPDEGVIRYGENEIGAIHMDQWRRSFGYVLQQAPLLSGSIRENILYGADREVGEEELIAAAKIADAYDFITEFPEGFDQEVGEGGGYLSGGQRQRIAIARAVIIAPSVILMDEATSALDYQSDHKVWQAVQRAMEGRTIVLIAHDMEDVMTADHIVVMDSGAVEAAGTHDELMRVSPTYREYVRLQTAKEV